MNQISERTKEHIKRASAVALLDLHGQSIDAAGDELLVRFNAMLATCKYLEQFVGCKLDKTMASRLTAAIALAEGKQS